MAVRISSSKFLESSVAKQAALNGIDDPLPSGGGPLPAGIRDGVAKLTDIYFENDEKYGECFRAKAKIVLPKVHDGRFIEGKETEQWITFNQDNLEVRIPKIRDILKALGGREIFGDAKNVDFIKIVSFLANVAKKGNLYFGFSTSPKENSEWPWQNWHAAIPGFVPPGTTPVALTNEAQKKTKHSSSNGSVLANFGGGINTSVVREAAGLSPEPWTTADNSNQPVGEYTDTEDLSSVINRAENKDVSAQDKLSDWAKELGYTQDDLDESESWRQVGDWVISGKRKDEESESVATKPSRDITVGQVYTYQPPNKKEGGPRLKGRECRVTNVDNMRNVVTLVNLAKKDEVYEVEIDDENLK